MPPLRDNPLFWKARLLSLQPMHVHAGTPCFEGTLAPRWTTQLWERDLMPPAKAWPSVLLALHAACMPVVARRRCPGYGW